MVWDTASEHESERAMEALESVMFCASHAYVRNMLSSRGSFQTRCMYTVSLTGVVSGSESTPSGPYVQDTECRPTLRRTDVWLH
jgi:hypothetical protein